MQSDDCCCCFFPPWAEVSLCSEVSFLPRSTSRCAPPATSIPRLQALTWWSRSAQPPGSWRLGKEKMASKNSKKPMSLFDNSSWLRLSLSLSPYMLICILCWLQYLLPSLLRQVIYRLMMVNFMLDSVWESSFADVNMTLVQNDESSKEYTLRNYFSLKETQDFSFSDLYHVKSSTYYFWVPKLGSYTF